MQNIELRLIKAFASAIYLTKEIDTRADASLDRFYEEVKGAEEFLKNVKGVLVLPGVIKGGLIVSGEYGKGALRIDGKTVDYYTVTSAPYGYTLGGQKKDVILVFMQNEALEKFRESSGWKVGVDGSVVLVDLGVAASIDTAKIKEPIVGFIFGKKGLMFNLTLEGSKFTKLKKKGGWRSHNYKIETKLCL